MSLPSYVLNPCTREEALRIIAKLRAERQEKELAALDHQALGRCFCGDCHTIAEAVALNGGGAS